MNFGSYTVVKEIGVGGAGVVYRARDVSGRDVAIKVLKKAGPGECARFAREQRLLGALGESEGFVPLLDAGDAPRPQLVMPFLEGGTLRERLRAAPFPVKDVVALGRVLARALARAHAKGIVHRDVKPENVLFRKPGQGVGDSEDALVSDLGLAKHFSLDDESAAKSVALSRTNELRGTVGYMPHEQLKNARDVGPQADVFALGAVLYECLGGQPLFAAGSLVDLFARVEAGRFTPLDRLRPDAPAWLVAVIHRALAFAAKDRFADAGELERVLAFEEKAKLPVAAVVRALAVLGVAGGLVVFAASALSKRPVSAAALADQAARSFGAGDVERAAALTSEALAHDPRVALAWHVRALLAERAGDAVATVQAASKAAELEPSDARAWELEAEARERLGDPRAFEDAARALELEPRSAVAWRIRAAGLGARGEVAEGIVAATKALEVAPAEGAAWSVRAKLRLLRESGPAAEDRAGALADAEQALALAPEDADALAARGHVLRERGDLERARADLERAVARGSALEGAWLDLARIASARRDRPRTLEAATRVIELGDRSVVARTLRSEARLAARDTEGALEDARRARSLDPASVEAAIALVRVRFARGENAEALAEARACVERAPEDARALTMLGRAHMALGSHQEAIDAATRAIARDSFLAEAYLVRGNSLANLAPPRLGEAAEDLSEALRIDPLLVEAWQSRGWVRERRHELEEAVSDLTKALELDPSHSGSWSNKGSALVKLRRFEEAIRDLTKAIELDPKNGSGWCMRALAREQLRRSPEAVTDMDRTLELLPDRPDLLRLRARLRGKAGDDAGRQADEARAAALEKKR